MKPFTFRSLLLMASSSLVYSAQVDQNKTRQNHTHSLDEVVFIETEKTPKSLTDSVSSGIRRKSLVADKPAPALFTSRKRVQWVDLASYARSDATVVTLQKSEKQTDSPDVQGEVKAPATVLRGKTEPQQ